MIKFLVRTALPIFAYYPAEPPTPPSMSTTLIEGHENQHDLEGQKHNTVQTLN